MGYFSRQSAVLATPHPMSIGVQPALWLDAFDPGSLIFNGSDISGWNDKSGNSADAVQPVALEQPLFVSNGLNGRPTIRYAHAGIGKALTIIGGLPIGQNVARTLFIVMNPASGFGATGSEVFGVNTGQAISFASDLIRVRDAPRDRFSAAGTVPQDTPNIITVTDIDSTGSFLNAYNGATQIKTNDLSAFGYNLSLDLGIGTSGFSSRSFHGDISEVIVYAGVLSAINRLRILSYLTAKWGF